MHYRIEKDVLGEVQVPAKRLYGAQTARSLHHFAIGKERFDPGFIQSFAVVKKAAALANKKLGLLTARKTALIVRACDEIFAGYMADEFPLSVWQTGSGTQTNMNVNEVIANRAIQLVKGKLGSKVPIHPNDDVNKGQSSNDVFPTVMHIAAVVAICDQLLPSLVQLQKGLEAKARQYKGLIKIGRTHFMDATPVTLGQEFSGYAYQVTSAAKRIQAGLPGLRELALGATAVGTGINAHPRFATLAIKEVSRLTGQHFARASNPFSALACHDAIVEASGALRGLAVTLSKIANDIRFLSSGPRCGIGEIVLPANEPGSSIMPGKVNPTQCEALLMVCSQVIGNDVTIAIAGASGNCELNVQKPVMIHNLLQSIRLLSGACRSFYKHCVVGIKANKARLQENLDRSLMLVTALAPSLGYDQAAMIAQKAYRESLTLRQAAIASGLIDGKTFDVLVDPRKMV